MANQLTYFNADNFNLDYDRDTFGLLIDGIKFVALDSPLFADAIATIKNFALHIDNGNCTFIKEFRKSGDRSVGYWYACKRTNGKLKKLYFGHEFTKDKLMQIVDRLAPQVAQVTQVTQITDDEITTRDFKRIAATWQDSANLAWDRAKELEAELEALKLATPVLAGHGKSDRHIQTSLMELANQPDKKLTHRCNELERQNKDLNRRLVDALEKIERRNQIIDSLEQTVKDLTQITNANHDLTSRLEAKNAALTQEKDIALSDLRQAWQNVDLRQNQIEDLKTTVGKYRSLATGKNKKAHPRFAYLLDFLGEIDNIF